MLLPYPWCGQRQGNGTHLGEALGRRVLARPIDTDYLKFRDGALRKNPVSLVLPRMVSFNYLI